LAIQLRNMSSTQNL